MSDQENDTKNASGFHPSRRSLLKLVGAVSAYTVLPGFAAATSTQDAPGKKKLAITYSGYPYDRVAALTSGDVEVEGCELTYTPDRIGNLNTHVFSGSGTRDVSEVGLHPFMLAWANEEFRDYTLLPVFPLRVFRHKSIFIRTDRGITTPKDLKGKRVATPGYSSTSLTWLRGILQDEYGVGPADVKWFVSAEDSSVKDTGGPSKLENVLPEGLTITPGPAGKDESDMLADGDVDALFHAMEPRCYIEGHSKVSRLFPDFRTVEQAYFKKTGIFPIMHAVAMRRKTVDDHPWLPVALFKAFSEAKQETYEELRTMAWALNSLPWAVQEVEDTEKLMGDNFWPYGLEASRKSLAALFKYSHEQGLASRRLEVEEMFHPSTRKLVEA
jgi:4,5-dihydroxyphthalate decarboxylase